EFVEDPREAHPAPVGPLGRGMKGEGSADLLAQADRDGFGQHEVRVDRDAEILKFAFELVLDRRAETNADRRAGEGRQRRAHRIADAEAVTLEARARREGLRSRRGEIADVE